MAQTQTVPFHLLSKVRHHRSLAKAHHRPATRGAFLHAISSARTVRQIHGSLRRCQKLTHLDETGSAHMVDISSKKETTRLATATATLLFSNPETYSILTDQQLAKGDAIAVARIAAIQAAKKTADLIPLAHPALNITSINVRIHPFSGQDQSMTTIIRQNGQDAFNHQHNQGGVTVEATVKCQGKTGIEMEAITAATIGTVTLYDMLKAVDKGMVISAARVTEKEGGKSGDWIWDAETNELTPSSTNEQVVNIKATAQNTIPTGSRSIEPLQQNQSEVDEWNSGLTAEFLIREAPDEESGPGAGEGRLR